ncbi:hypothetical protein SM021_002341 [Cronobacter muytjensii]|nr:hypothetical protein [Cronobacter muytjensii]
MISKATTSLWSVASGLMSSQKTVVEANVDFKGFSGTVSESSNACFTLVDERGYEWGAPRSPIMCQDAPNVLPDTPADCYLNGNVDLNVDMGSLERSKIATIPVSGAAGNIKKSFPVLCTRDAGMTVLTSFQFTPLTISGNEVVSTDASNLGIAIFYKGKLIGPSSTPVTENFEVGYTDRELEFQAVRNPNSALDEIPTGNFTASAVMIMTAQ